MRLLPSGDQLYAALNVIGDLAIIDTASMSQVSLADDALSIEDFAFSPNGFEAFIGYFSRVRDFTVSIEEPGLLFDGVGFPKAVTVSPNSELAFIASSLDNSNLDTDADSLFVIDAFTNDLEATPISITADPSAIVVNRAGTRAYISSGSQGSIDVIDLPNRTVMATVALGSRLADIEVSPNGSELYVSEPNTNNVFVVDAILAEDGIPGNELLAAISVGAAPAALAITPDGNTLLVAEQQDDTVGVIDLTSRTVVSVIASVDVPFDLGVHPDGTRAYVLDPLSLQGILELPLAATDNTSPVVIDVSPQDRGQFLLQDSPIEIVFNEKMDAATFNNTNIEVVDASLVPIPGTFSGTGNDVATIFTPDAGVRYELNSQITVNVNTGLTDVSGNAMATTTQRLVPVQVMQLPNLLNINIGLDASGITATGIVGAVEPNSEIIITNLTTLQEFRTDADATGAFAIILIGLDTDGYEMVTQLFNGRAKTDPLPLPVGFSIVIPNPALISYTPGLAGTLKATGSAGAVDPQSSLIQINNQTSGQSFSTTTVNADGSFELGIFANQGDSLNLVSTIFGSIVLDPIPLSVPAFVPPVIDFITPDRFIFGDPVTLSIVGTDLGDVPANIKLEVGGVIRTDFTIDIRTENPAQQVIVVGLPAGADSGGVQVSFAGQSSNALGYIAQLAQNTSPFAEEIISSAITGDPNAVLGAKDGVFADLGEGGELIIRLGSTVTDGPGNDIQIFEDTSDGEDCYEVLVSPSSTGPFDSLGQFCGTAFVNLAGHSDVRFIKIVDATDGGNAARIDGVVASRVKVSVTILLDGVPIGVQGLSSSSFIVGPAATSASIAPGDVQICKDDTTPTLTVSVNPAPQGGGGYGGGCSDSISWTAAGGTFSSPSAKSTTYTPAVSGQQVTVTANVTRSGNCSSATAGSPPAATATVDVIEVEKLESSEGEEWDDMDGTDDTKTFVAKKDTTGDVTVTATPKPAISEAKLPACWSFTATGSTAVGMGKLQRKITKTAAKKTDFKASTGPINKQLDVVIGAAKFKRSATTNTYGYDEIDTSKDDDDHVSVKKSGSTKVLVEIEGGVDRKYFKFVPVNTATAKVTDPGPGASSFDLEILGQAVNKATTEIKIRLAKDAGTEINKIAVNVYKETAITSKYFKVFLTGDNTTKPPAIGQAGIETAANAVLKYPVVSVSVGAPSDLAVAFDLNGNKKVDYYNSCGSNDETKAVYDALAAQPGVDSGTIALLKDTIPDNWCLSQSFVAPGNKLKLAGGVNLLAVGNTLSIGKPDGTDTENFTISAINGNELTLSANLTKNHPLTVDPKTSHTMVTPNDIAGLSASPPSRPALVIGSSAAGVGKLVAHEQMHGQGLSDVNDTGNVMHWNTGSAPTTLPFRFKDLVQVKTGSANPKPGSPTDNQWNDPPR